MSARHLIKYLAIALVRFSLWKRTACKQQNQIPNQADEVRQILSVWRLPEEIAGIRIWRQLARSHRNFPLSETSVSILHGSVDKYLIVIPPHCVVCILMRANAHGLAAFCWNSVWLWGEKETYWKTMYRPDYIVCVDMKIIHMLCLN